MVFLMDRNPLNSSLFVGFSDLIFYWLNGVIGRDKMRNIRGEKRPLSKNKPIASSNPTRFAMGDAFFHPYDSVSMNLFELQMQSC